ncbi:MAG: 5'-nucleotidase [Gemmatimonadaceae bacterium]|nr:5'-nucleotidase [Gemmatimonadaceae bacterium]
MPYDLSQYLVIGVSSRALFDLSIEDEIFRAQGLSEYSRYQIEHEYDLLRPGAAFPLVSAILALNALAPGKRKAEVVVMSRNSGDTSLRIFNSIKHYELDITRAALTGGASLAPYLHAYKVDLFLSADEADVQSAVDAGIAAGVIYAPPAKLSGKSDQIRIAFDGDAVLFSDESERIYQSEGLEAFLAHETVNAQKPLPEGPFAKLLKTLSALQNDSAQDTPPIRVALVTARNAPAHERVIRTLRRWNVRVDEAHFLGGVSKAEVLQAFGAHIFFDDQDGHVGPASKFVPAARVPYLSRPSVKKAAEPLPPAYDAADAGWRSSSAM